jgi:hypothetical protein
VLVFSSTVLTGYELWQKVALAYCAVGLLFVFLLDFPVAFSSTCRPDLCWFHSDSARFHFRSPFSDVRESQPGEDSLTSIQSPARAAFATCAQCSHSLFCEGFTAGSSGSVSRLKLVLAAGVVLSRQESGTCIVPRDSAHHTRFRVSDLVIA